MSDWWSTLDSEQFQTEMVQMDTSYSACRGPEFAQSPYDQEAPYVTVRKGNFDVSPCHYWPR